MKVIKKTIQYGEHTLSMETGAIARQATGSVLVSMGDTVVLVTVVGKNEGLTDRDFFPLTVNYQEKFYSTGKLPGGFMKREGRPTTRETLISRLIDRPIRPLFPEGFTDEVQIIATVMSMDPQIDPDIPALIGASAALAISGLPFQGPVAAARVGYKDGIFLINPTTKELEDSSLDLVVAGTEKAVLMVESEAKELPEDTMLEAVMFGHSSMQVVIEAIKELAAEAGKASWDWQENAHLAILRNKIQETYANEMREAFTIINKLEREEKFSALKTKVCEALVSPEDTEEAIKEPEVVTAFHDVQRTVIRNKIIKDKNRIDGRDLVTVRPIDIQLGKFPRTHGSAIFTRGETQATVLATLGTEKDAQIVDVPAGESAERFLLHYNFPPFCTGETGRMGSPKRREIGHGNLARRALLAVVPNKEQFPYVVRVVSEITESNGSSSMATVCGGCLSMMDAGVPLKAPVAGIAMGLIKEGEDFVVLTDILGDEDHFGDMDFKVAGTKDGVTALQMDIKITGITKEIMQTALRQAKDGRMHILNLMLDKIQKPRDHVSDFAPRIMTIQINPDKIRDVIGKGGATIKGIVEETGAQIDISDQGVVTIAAVDQAAGKRAREIIEGLTAEAEVGKIYTGKVAKIMDFGAFVTILPNTDGLVHISQIAQERVNDVHDYLHEGQEVRVKVLEIDRQGKIRLSMKAVAEDEK